jgi:hypothetical protein
VPTSPCAPSRIYLNTPSRFKPSNRSNKYVAFCTVARVWNMHCL